MNTIWHVPAAGNESGLKAIVELCKERFYSFALVTGAGVLLLLSVAGSTWASALGRHWGAPAPVLLPWLHGAGFVASYLVITALFAAIYA